MKRTYLELKTIPTFNERFEYLKLSGNVGYDTFGFDRVFNQMFYQSKVWKDVRRQVILRDYGLDLGLEDHPISGKILVHHMNPISMNDILNTTEYLLNPNYLISVSHDTHNAIHYGSIESISCEPVIRTLNDTCPWKR